MSPVRCATMLVLFIAGCLTNVTKAVNSPLSKYVMEFDSKRDLRCSSDWDDFCGDTLSSRNQSKHRVTMCQWRACANQTQWIRRGQLCDGTFDCDDLSDECLCEDRILKTRKTYDICTKIYTDKIGDICMTVKTDDVITVRRICDGVINCAKKEDEKFCQYNCKRRDIRHDVIYYECIRNGNMVKLNWRHLFDNVRDCDDVSDEWHTHLPYCPRYNNVTYECKYYQRTSHCPGPLRKVGDKRFFSNPLELYDSTVYYYLTWILGTFALFGNLMIVLNSIYVLYRDRFGRAWPVNDEGLFDTNDALNNYRGRNTMKHINVVMVISLCISDMVTGMQVILMATAATVYSEDFWRVYPEYLGSWMCITNSVLGMVASEASAFTIFVIASVRLYTVSRPFSASKNLRIKHVLLALCAVWIISLSFAAIPLLQRFDNIEMNFTYSVALTPIANLEATIIEKQTLENMVRKLAFLNKEELNGTRFSNFTNCDVLHNKRWSELLEFVSTFSGRNKWIYLGYYSQITACLPPIILSVNEPGWSYSLGILLIDFGAYIFVMIAYVVVYKKTTNSSNQASVYTKNRNTENRKTFKLRRTSQLQPNGKRLRHHSRGDEYQEMQKRIFILVATDFACWVPVCTFTFLNLAIDNVVFKNQPIYIISIMMIQINSVINPVVYSKQARKVIKHSINNLFTKLTSWLRKITRREEDVSVEDDNPFGCVKVETKNQYTSTADLGED